VCAAVVSLGCGESTGGSAAGAADSGTGSESGDSGNDSTQAVESDADQPGETDEDTSVIPETDGAEPGDGHTGEVDVDGPDAALDDVSGPDTTEIDVSEADVGDDDTQEPDIAAPATGDVRFVHLGPFVAPLDVYQEAIASPLVSNLSYGGVSASQTVIAGEQSFLVRKGGAGAASDSIGNVDVNVSPAERRTVALIHEGETAAGIVLDEPLNAPPLGVVTLRLVHAAPSLGTVSIFEAFDPENPTLLHDGVAFGGATGYALYPVGLLQLGLDTNGDGDVDWLFARTFASGDRVTLLISEDSQGDPVALAVAAEGAAWDADWISSEPYLPPPTVASLRVLRLSAGDAAQDVWIDGELVQAGLGFGEVSAAESLLLGGHTVAVGEAGGPIEAAQAFEVVLDSENGSYTLAVFDGKDGLETSLLPDSVGGSGQNNTPIRIIQAAAEAGTVDFWGAANGAGPVLLFSASAPLQASSVLQAAAGPWSIAVDYNNDAEADVGFSFTLAKSAEVTNLFLVQDAAWAPSLLVQVGGSAALVAPSSGGPLGPGPWPPLPELHVATLEELTVASSPAYDDNVFGLVTGSRLASWLQDWPSNKPAGIKGRLVILQVVPSVANSLQHLPANEAAGILSFVVPASDFTAKRNNGLSSFETDIPSGEVVDAWLAKYAIDPREDLILITFEQLPNTQGSINQSVGRAWLFFKYWGTQVSHLAILNGSINWNAAQLGIGLESAVNQLYSQPTNDGEVTVRHLGFDNTALSISLEEVLAILSNASGSPSASSVRIVDARGGAEALGLKKATSTGRNQCASFTGSGTNNRCSTPFEGRIKGAKNVPWTQFIDTAENGFRYKGYESVKQIFDSQVGYTGEVVHTIQYCRTNQRSMVTGIVANVILGYPTRFYETSFIEWGHVSAGPPDSPNKNLVPASFPFRTDLESFTEHAVLHPDDLSAYTPGGTLGTLTQPVTWVAGPNYNDEADVNPVVPGEWPPLNVGSSTTKLAIEEDRAYLRGVTPP
jgi:3-mercaptopyruvate sulfurtransferase SseA